MTDLLQRHLRDLPAFRALLRAVEARFYRDLPLPTPILDLGCGDGHFGAVALGNVDAGFDPWWEPLKEARDRDAYRTLAMALGARMPYGDEAFASVVSNSVLEHIEDLPPVLSEVSRVLQPGGWFHFCVPGPGFTAFLSIARALERLGLGAAAEGYRDLFNRISRHHHCDDPSVWGRRLESAGMRLVESWPYFSPRALAALEWGHYLGLPSLFSKALTGRWVLCPSRANLWITERLVRTFYEEPMSQPPQSRDTEAAATRSGAYLFFVARKPRSSSSERNRQHEPD